MQSPSYTTMLHYQLRRPTPIQVHRTRARRQDAGLGAIGPGSAQEGPESPDSPGSSPSTTGVPSPGDNSDSEDDEPPSPKKSSSNVSGQATSTSTFPAAATTLLISTTSTRVTSTISSQPPIQSSQPPIQPSQPPIQPSQPPIQSPSGLSSQTSSSASKTTSPPAFTQTPTSQGIGAVVPPQVTDSSTAAATSTRLTSTMSSASPTSTASSISQVFSSKVARPTQPITSSTSLSTLPPPARTGVPIGEDDSPRRTRPEPTLMSKGAEAAAITLSIIGAIALAVCILFYCKRRRRRRNEKLEAELERDAAAHAALQTSEVSQIKKSIAPFSSSDPHMTKTSERSNTLFGPGSYSRPETVSTRNGSRIPEAQSTPNPFADPPLNKAFDVLAGRPRSTTLTDRGSWIKNPFKDPESDRFDPFGELQAKARRERIKQVELARREAELERQFEEKEKMGLSPPERAMDRKGSGVTLEGIGVLDRSNGAAHR